MSYSRVGFLRFLEVTTVNSIEFVRLQGFSLTHTASSANVRTRQVVKARRIGRANPSASEVNVGIVCLNKCACGNSVNLHL